MIFFLFLIVIIIFVIINSNKNNSKNFDMNSKKSATDKPIPSSTDTEEIRYKDFYQAKRYLISLAELNFYNVLCEVAKELNLVVFSQVSLYNIVETKNTPYKNIAFNKIRAKSIDFVLTDSKNCRILLCIELDDSSHRYSNRIERDKFIDDLFYNLKIDFIRINVSTYYNKEILKNQIINSIKFDNYYLNKK